jgi:hypothetical protein
MNSFDQAIRLQQLQTTRRLDHRTIVTRPDFNAGIQTERLSQSSDNNVFSEFAQLHFPAKKTPTSVIALNRACMAIGTSSEPDSS